MTRHPPPAPAHRRPVPAIPNNFVARGSLGSLAIKLATVGLAFATQMLLARLMGAGQYGAYIYALAWLNALVLVARLGTDGLLTRFAAAYAIREQWGLLKGLVRFGYRVVGLACLVLCGAAWAVWAAPPPALDFAAKLVPDALFLAALLLLPINALGGVGQSLLFGLKRPWQAQWPEPVSRAFMLAVAGAAYWWFGDLSAPLAMACTVLAALLGCVLGGYWLVRALPRPLAAVQVVAAPGEWWSVALPMLLMAFLRMLLGQSDVLLIGWLLGDTQAAGLYAVASRLAELTTFGLQAVNTTLAPTIAELYATRQTARLQDIVTRSAQGVFAFTAVVGLALGLLGEWTLGLFGPAFVAAYPALLILLVGQTINAATGSVGYLMTMTGHQRQAAWLVALAGTLTVALNVTLIPVFGIQGAAIANATGMALVNLTMLVFVARRLKINSTVFRRIRIGYGPA